MSEDNKDHDLLIRLSTQFESLEKSQSTNWANFNDKFSQLLTVMNGKADKEDLRQIREAVTGLDNRLEVLEDSNKTAETKKQVILNMGNIGVKFWFGLSATITFLLGVYNGFFNK